MAVQRSSTTNFANAASATLQDLQHRVGLEGWWVLRRNDHEHVVLAAIDGVFGQRAGTVVSWEDSYCRLTIEQDAPPVAPDIDQVPCYAQARALNGIYARSLIVVPLTAPDGRLIGVLRALGTEVRPELEEHLATVQVAGDVLGVLLAHELELTEQVIRAARAEGAAHTDALTGISNRRAWDAAIAIEEARCARHADQAAVIALDVNGLSVLNDTRGHNAGDHVLSTTARVISERIRPADVVARIGGDEFAVLLPRTDVAGAWALARDLQRALRAAGVSVSTGVAGRSSRTGLMDAWHQADAAMYRDKTGQRTPLVASVQATASGAVSVSVPSSPRQDGVATRSAKDGAPSNGASPGCAASSRVGELPAPRGSRETPWRLTSVAHADCPLVALHGNHANGVDKKSPTAAWLTANASPPSAKTSVDALGDATLGAALDSARGEAGRVFDDASGGVVASAPADAGTGPVEGLLEGLLDLVRRQLGAQAAYVSVFADGQRRMRNLVTSVQLPVAVGDLVSREDGPSWHVATGHAPAVCADVASEPVLAALPEVRTLGIRSFAGVPLRAAASGSAGTSDGDLYGSLCVFSQHPNPSWGNRDAAVLQAVTEPLMQLIRAEDAQQAAHHQVLERLDRLEVGEGLQMHFQPVIDLHTGHRVGAEALARFPGSGLRPDEWFTMAASVGAGAELELRAVRAALPALQHEGFAGYLAVNLSPQSACVPALPRLLSGLPLERVVVEITEHEEVTDYDQLRLALAPLRAAGLRLAVDDTGAGYASMRHVLSLVPDLIKLDISLVRDIHTDPARRALAAALTTFATATGAQVIAEGIETAEELACLRGVGVHHGQGYHLAQPAPLEPMA